MESSTVVSALLTPTASQTSSFVEGQEIERKLAEAAPTSQILEGITLKEEGLSESSVIEALEQESTAAPSPEIKYEKKSVILKPAVIHDNIEVGLGSLPDQRRDMVVKKGGKLTLMLVGPSGYGKSCFINTLCATDLFSTDEARSPTNGVTIQVHDAELYENAFKLGLTIVDCPGFGDLIDNSNSWVPLCNFIDAQMRNFLFQEEQPDRRHIVDHRVHACLYFVSPTRRGLKKLDIITMRELSKRVNLIPVIAKAEGYTQSEVERLKMTIRQTLASNGIHVCKYLLERGGTASIENEYPYTIIGANGVFKNKLGQTVRGREYPWGVSEPENEQHCDFVKLRDLLMREHMLDLITSTEQHYEKYRSEVLRFRLFLAEQRAKGEPLSVKASSESSEVLNMFSVPGYQPEVEGINSLKQLQTIPQRDIEKLTMEYSPIFLQRVAQLKARMSEIVVVQDHKFKEWKRTLFAKQESLNEEIEKIQKRAMRLSDIVNSLRGVMESGSTLTTDYSGSATTASESNESTEDSYDNNRDGEEDEEKDDDSFGYSNAKGTFEADSDAERETLTMHTKRRSRKTSTTASYQESMSDKAHLKSSGKGRRISSFRLRGNKGHM